MTPEPSSVQDDKHCVLCEQVSRPSRVQSALIADSQWEERASRLSSSISSCPAYCMISHRIAAGGNEGFRYGAPFAVLDPRVTSVEVSKA